MTCPGSVGPVVLGCTAGLRDAIQTGKVSKEQLKAFEGMLHERFPNLASFRILEGEQEGRLELEAAKYCLQKATSAGEDIDMSQVGLLSSGGASSLTLTLALALAPTLLSPNPNPNRVLSPREAPRFK